MFRKTLMVSAVLISGISSSYANCIKDICVNNTIIDDYDYIGTVVSVDKSKNEVNYKRSGYTAIKTTSPYTLSPKINSERFPIQKEIIDNYNYLGKVLIVFKDGRIQYKRDAYSEKKIIKKVNLTPKVSNLGSLLPNTKVIDNYDYLGVVKALFEDGRVQYIRNGYSGKKIINQESLTLEVEKIGNLSKGKIIIDSYDYIGKVNSLYKDGRIQYTRNGYSGKKITKGTQLKIKIEKLNGLAAGFRVIDDYDYIGTILNIFEDGRIQYTRNGYSGKKITKSLVKELEILPSGLKKNTVVLDDYDYVSTINYVFADGRAQYRRDGYSGNKISKNFSKEVEVSDLYNKQENYASGLSFGKAIKFFQNGKIQMESNHGKKVVSTMFPEADSVRSLVVGDEIIVPSEKSFTIEKLFSNSTAQITIQRKNRLGESIDKVELTKIMDLSSNERTLNQKLNQWVQNISYNLKTSDEQSNQNFYLLNNINNNSVDVKDYLELKILLVNYIEKNKKNLNLSKQEIKDVLYFLENTQLSTEPADNATAVIDNSQMTTYQVVLNKKKLANSVISILDELDLNYTLVSESEVVENSPIIRLSFKKIFGNRTCNLNVQANNTSITKVIKKNRSGVLVECLDQLREILTVE
jgi:hypothetical protein